MNLIQHLQENWDKSNFIKISLNKSLKEQIEENTVFLNSYYSNIPLRTRAYVLVNDITEQSIPRCKCECGEVCAIDKTYTENGFRLYANSNCSRKSKTISSESKNKLDNYEWIYNQRIIQKKSIEQIAKELSISTIPVVKYLKKHKIHGLIDSRRRNSHSTSILSDKEKLEELYKTGLTCDEIGEQIGVAKSTVARWLNIYEIDIRLPNSYERKINKVSKEENTLYEYVQSIYGGNIIQSNRSVLNGKELDIYLPDYKLAIEYNGLYSHQHRPSESKECLIKGKSYHLNKTLMCEKQGIQLLQFYSDEWLLQRKYC
jgi:transposase